MMRFSGIAAAFASCGLAVVTAAAAAPGNVVINEVVTDPKTDWSTTGFDGRDGNGPVGQGSDEWVELLVKADGLDLTGWTVELDNAAELFSGDLTARDLTGTGAFQISTYTTDHANPKGEGRFTCTRAGDYLVLGNPMGGESMDDDVRIMLRDREGGVVDEVALGGGGNAPSGDSAGKGDEAVARIPDGMDTDDDEHDFVAQTATLGRSNGAITENLTVGEGEGYDFHSIQKAVDAANNVTLTRVRVYPKSGNAPYEENILIDMNIDLSAVTEPDGERIPILPKSTGEATIRVLPVSTSETMIPRSFSLAGFSVSGGDPSASAQPVIEMAASTGGAALPHHSIDLRDNEIMDGYRGVYVKGIPDASAYLIGNELHGLRSAAIDLRGIDVDEAAEPPARMQYAMVWENTIEENPGTGIALSQIEKALIGGNAILRNGGDGVRLDDVRRATLVNNAVMHSEGDDGIEVKGRYYARAAAGEKMEVSVIHTTICGNKYAFNYGYDKGTGPGSSSLMPHIFMLNSVIALNSGKVVYDSGSGVTCARACCVWSNGPGGTDTLPKTIPNSVVGIIPLPACLTTATGGGTDYHLMRVSPCIDKGLKEVAQSPGPDWTFMLGTPIPPTDIDGQYRDEKPDIGADEYPKRK